MKKVTTFKEVLDNHKEQKCLVNGQEGKIKAVEEDHLILTVITGENEKKSTEEVYWLLSDITQFSLGAKNIMKQLTEG